MPLYDTLISSYIKHEWPHTDSRFLINSESVTSISLILILLLLRPPDIIIYYLLNLVYLLFIYPEGKTFRKVIQITLHLYPKLEISYIEPPLT